MTCEDYIRLDPLFVLQSLSVQALYSFAILLLCKPKKGRTMLSFRQALSLSFYPACVALALFWLFLALLFRFEGASNHLSLICFISLYSPIIFLAVTILIRWKLFPAGKHKDFDSRVFRSW